MVEMKVVYLVSSSIFNVTERDEAKLNQKGQTGAAKTEKYHFPKHNKWSKTKPLYYSRRS